MRDLVRLFVHLLTTVIRLSRPGGLRSVLAESVLLKHQLQILNRSRRRAPNLHASDRLIAGLCALLVRPGRLVRSAIVVKPSTLLNFHRALVQRKYVRRILAAHYHPSADGDAPSWLTFIGHAKDSLHSVDLFRCESVVLRPYWVLVVMDQYTRHHWIRNSSRDRRWQGTLSHV
jgi:putative transposase